jgi:anti-sigma B factor antagonist
MNLEFRKVGEKVLVATVLDSRIDGTVLGDFRKRFDEHLGGIEYLALDVSAVTFIDSTGLGAIISLRKALPPQGELAICCANEAVDNLLRLTRLNKVFLMFDDVASAEKDLSARP